MGIYLPSIMHPPYILNDFESSLGLLSAAMLMLLPGSRGYDRRLRVRRGTRNS